MKMPDLYLTIDDSPSVNSDALLDFLKEQGIQAMIFARADLAELNPAPVIRAIAEGHIVGSHGYTHVHASKLGLEAARESITKSKQILDELHERAGVARRCVYFRFPHVDRGMGSWLVNPAECSELVNILQKELIAGGIRGASFEPPTVQAIALKNALQDHLKSCGFHQNPFRVLHPYIAQTELDGAYDVPFTYSTADWQITDRHRGKWGPETIDDLMRRIDDDPVLGYTDTPHIVLCHDQDETVPFSIALLRHFLARGFRFLRHTSV